MSPELQRSKPLPVSNINGILPLTYGISSFLIFNAGIAKGIYGENFRLEDQFLEMCKNKDVDLRGFFNQEVSLDISTDSINAYDDYYQMLTQMSERSEFLNSDINTNIKIVYGTNSKSY